jgi:predicted GIY-YIG superfamily endonuclease
MQHYVGFTRNLPQCLRAHREGDGCVITRRAFDRGIGFTLARVWWPGTLRLERQIKARGPMNNCSLCPSTHLPLTVSAPPHPRIGAGH